ncbi:hypothetical protein VOLCADRAFT_99544 [Volvox carteri f. nagariensis]|uniref:Uncharacterized protein n=1 Tax=Volvox carteri f. nagariensis TaxID=3068 RepID=D8UI10_VOLCA|nr:uncharacterized protein VOLCADRAFT_99544 [Volvox carteri f. nagariensis]EFJ40673.1 hypothetical protein VOLCADRAFT_99544 [Volvox carteri f. nagariensis]|eukprot:XP_002958299.1 hypothetical protein VOLCADRAFT_99544 [Volvox carteri f. nagariensis]
MNTCPSWCSLADFLAGYRPGTLQFMRTSLGRPLEAAVSQISATADTHSSGRNTGPLPVSQRGSHGSNGITHRQDPIPADGQSKGLSRQFNLSQLAFIKLPVVFDTHDLDQVICCPPVTRVALEVVWQVKL